MAAPKVTPDPKKPVDEQLDDEFIEQYVAGLNREREDLAKMPKIHDVSKGEYVEDVLGDDS